MKSIRVLSAVLTVLLLVVSAGCTSADSMAASDHPASSSDSGNSGGSGGSGGY
ncbi:MAG: hypothetical protein ACTHKH_05155 [Trinickia sp.]|jgi:hypothetical protein